MCSPFFWIDILYHNQILNLLPYIYTENGHVCILEPVITRNEGVSFLKRVIDMTVIVQNIYKS